VAIKAVIFDCDGVLFHSEKANVEFYKAVLDNAGLPPLPTDSDMSYHALASVQLFEVLRRQTRRSRACREGCPATRLRAVLPIHGA
jgi:beta-phosphoglucomutase-like phosphatase (HAD superfamily)